MNGVRYFYNFKSKSAYFLWLLAIVTGLIGIQLLFPIIRPARYSGAFSEWVLTICAIVFITAFFLFSKRFVSISFDDQNREIAITTNTLVSSDKTQQYNYSTLTFKSGKTFIEIYHGNQKVLKLEKTGLEEDTFEDVLKELQAACPTNK